MTGALGEYVVAGSRVALLDLVDSGRIAEKMEDALKRSDVRVAYDGSGAFGRSALERSGFAYAWLERMAVPASSSFA